MMAKQMKTLELYYPMIQFLILWCATQVFDQVLSYFTNRSLYFYFLRLRVAVGQATFMQSVPSAQPWNKIPY